MDPFKDVSQNPNPQFLQSEVLLKQIQVYENLCQTFVLNRDWAPQPHEVLAYLLAKYEEAILVKNKQSISQKHSLFPPAENYQDLIQKLNRCLDTYEKDFAKVIEDWLSENRTIDRKHHFFALLIAFLGYYRDMYIFNSDHKKFGTQILKAVTAYKQQKAKQLLNTIDKLDLLAVLNSPAKEILLPYVFPAKAKNEARIDPRIFRVFIESDYAYTIIRNYQLFEKLDLIDAELADSVWQIVVESFKTGNLEIDAIEADAIEDDDSETKLSNEEIFSNACSLFVKLMNHLTPAKQPEVIQHLFSAATELKQPSLEIRAEAIQMLGNLSAIIPLSSQEKIIDFLLKDISILTRESQIALTNIVLSSSQTIQYRVMETLLGVEKSPKIWEVLASLMPVATEDQKIKAINQFYLTRRSKATSLLALNRFIPLFAQYEDEAVLQTLAKELLAMTKDKTYLQPNETWNVLAKLVFHLPAEQQTEVFVKFLAMLKQERNRFLLGSIGSDITRQFTLAMPETLRIELFNFLLTLLDADDADDTWGNYCTANIILIDLADLIPTTQLESILTKLIQDIESSKSSQALATLSAVTCQLKYDDENKQIKAEIVQLLLQIAQQGDTNLCAKAIIALATVIRNSDKKDSLATIRIFIDAITNKALSHDHSSLYQSIHGLILSLNLEAKVRLIMLLDQAYQTHEQAEPMIAANILGLRQLTEATLVLAKRFAKQEMSESLDLINYIYSF